MHLYFEPLFQFVLCLKLFLLRISKYLKPKLTLSVQKRLSKEELFMRRPIILYLPQINKYYLFSDHPLQIINYFALKLTMPSYNLQDKVVIITGTVWKWVKYWKTSAYIWNQRNILFSLRGIEQLIVIYHCTLFQYEEAEKYVWIFHNELLFEVIWNPSISKGLVYHSNLNFEIISVILFRCQFRSRCSHCRGIRCWRSQNCHHWTQWDATWGSGQKVSRDWAAWIKGSAIIKYIVA